MDNPPKERFAAVLARLALFVATLAGGHLKELRALFAPLLAQKEPEGVTALLTTMANNSALPRAVTDAAAAALAELSYRAPAGWTPFHAVEAFQQHAATLFPGGVPDPGPKATPAA